MVGVALGTAALIVVLSAFNGLENVVSGMFSVFDPDLKISAAEGKTFHSADFPSEKIKSIKSIANYTEVVEENALLRNENKQHLAVIKGVDSAYIHHSALDTLIVAGNFLLQKDTLNFALLGVGVMQALGVNTESPDAYITAYMPRRTGNINMVEDPFNMSIIQPMGVFSSLQDFDDKYVIVPLRWARKLLEYNDELTSVEIRVNADADIDQVKESIKNMVGERFKVQNKLEQQELLFKMMKSERWGVFLILTFIIVIASFNSISSLIMLIIDKKKDIATLNHLGAGHATVRNIFFVEGVSITLIGAMVGIFMGFGVCWLQQRFGLVRLQGNTSFIFSAYPVKMIWRDFVSVFITVFAIGVIAAVIPASRISRMLAKK